MEPDKILYYVDSIHYPETEGSDRGIANNAIVQVSLLDVNKAEEPNDMLVTVPIDQLSFENGKKIADNNFVYYSANNQKPFENGNKDSRALELINRSSQLRKRLRKKYQDRPMDLPRTGNFSNSKIMSYHINVGHGNCSVILVESDDSYRIWMVDCGTAYYVKRPHLENIDDCFDDIAQRLGLDKSQLHISLFMLTHLHSDHYNGLEMLFNQGYCDEKTQFFINLDYAVASPAYVRILEKINNKGCFVKTPIRNVDSARKIQCIPTVIFPDKKVFKNKPSSRHMPCYIEPEANNSSAIYIVMVRGMMMLFPGDMEKKELDLMTSSGNCTPYLNRINYYCVSHHASITGHLDCKCLDPRHPCSTCIKCCKNNLNKAIVMGRDGAFSGIYNRTVINDFKPNIVYSEKDPSGKSVKGLILDWTSNACSYF
ncbi:MAG: hypothetical protein MJZ20_13435 [Bacteroidaceae bacterium]|nr:hypothetical protein [Bacteroidaceae bacterium]